eukprot:s1388_g18.t1
MHMDKGDAAVFQAVQYFVLAGLLAFRTSIGTPNWDPVWCRDGRPEGAAMRVLRHSEGFHDRLEALYQHFVSPIRLADPLTQGFQVKERLNGTTWLLLHTAQKQLSLLHLAFHPAASSLVTPVLLPTRSGWSEDWKLEAVLSLGSARVHDKPSHRNLLLVVIPISDDPESFAWAELDRDFGLMHLRIERGGEAWESRRPEGREARAQMEARSQFEPFTSYAVDLRSAVRQKVSTTVLPKSLVTGNSSEPLSYVNLSSVVEVPEKKEEEDGEKLRTWEVRHQKLETVKLVKDQALREMLEREVCMEDTPVTSSVAGAPVALVVKRQPGAAEFESFYHHMEETTQYVPDEDLVDRMRGYFRDAGGVVETQTALLSKKQNINSSHKSLKRALSLKRSIKAETRAAKDV